MKDWRLNLSGIGKNPIKSITVVTVSNEKIKATGLFYLIWICVIIVVYVMKIKIW